MGFLLVKKETVICLLQCVPAPLSPAVMLYFEYQRLQASLVWQALALWLLLSVLLLAFSQTLQYVLLFQIQGRYQAPVAQHLSTLTLFVVEQYPKPSDGTADLLCACWNARVLTSPNPTPSCCFIGLSGSSPAFLSFLRSLSISFCASVSFPCNSSACCWYSDWFCFTPGCAVGCAWSTTSSATCAWCSSNF